MHKPSPRFSRNLVAVMHDTIMAAVSFHAAVYLRLGDLQAYLAADYLKSGTVIFTLVCVAVFISMRFYRGLWRYASMRDLIAITKAATLSILIFSMMMFVFNRLENIPRSVPFINWMILLCLLGGPRFLYRSIKDQTLSWSMPLNESSRIPVLLIGATDNAERFIRDMSRDPYSPYEAVAIIDDRSRRSGQTIHHVPIYSGLERLQEVIALLERKNRRPQKIILTNANTPGEVTRHLLTLSENLGIPLARLPKPGEIRIGIAEQRDIQPIAVEDLLGRPQAVLDRDGMRQLVAGKTVLVTGAGGTIGGELVRQVAVLDPQLLLLLDSGELNLYQIEREIRAAFPKLSIAALLADVRDVRHIESIFKMHKPALVFHAAALKHVPMSEANMEEAILTNAYGTQVIAEACVKYGAAAMVLISTDKAVNPTNIMGASKRLAEMFCQSLAEASNHTTQFITVRFGNVLGSTGSVVPLFQEQLTKGGPITVTHPEMTRYFMTTREAVELVLQAAALGSNIEGHSGRVFVLDMGQPVRILDLALQMIRLAGLKPNEDIKIIYTGLRPGEKLHEELFYFSENAVKTAHDSIYLASPKVMDINQVRAGMETLLNACLHRQPSAAKTALKTLVPEYNNDH